MKKIFAVLLFFTLASAFAVTSPYSPWVDSLVQDSNYFPKRVVRGVYDFSKSGGAIGSYTLGFKLPANSIVTHTYFENSTSFTDGGSGTASLGCSGVADLYASADITGNSDGDITEGIQDDTVANYTSIAAGCTPKLHIDGAAATAGKLNVFVEYITTK